MNSHRPFFIEQREGERLYYENELIQQAKQMTAIEFLKRYRPGELVRCGMGEFQLHSHDSFKINEASSVWHWKSRDIGGKSALDYLIHVEGMSFLDAVRYLLEQEPPSYTPTPKSLEKKHFVLPSGAREAHHVELYLQSRGISLDVIHYCISKGILYESMPHHNCVFVGLNNEGVPRYAALRSTTDFPRPFKQDQPGSDKRFCFCIPPVMRCRRVAVYEAAPDAMAHMTLEGGRADKYRLSLGGIYAPVEHSSEHLFKKPLALGNFLANHPEVMELEICTDNDAAGRWVALQIAKYYSKEYKVKVNLPPKEGYDWADMAKEEKQERVARHRAAHLHLKEDDAR
ncbi:MAG: DUF3991 domain-containing protein [Ruthenibacterium lactatiformans]|uniref:DUF3991 domain-containing protein n=1 Tax=Ruthenibacterium lactatiformans TaxID=1550024 RepID=UPI003992099C